MTNTERIDRNTEKLTEVRELLASQIARLDALEARVDEHDSVKQQLAQLRTDHSLLEQSVSELLENRRKWGGHFWALLVALLAAILTAGSTVLLQHYYSN